MGFSRQEYWRGFPFPSPENLPNPESSPGLLHYRQISLPSELQRSVSISISIPISISMHTHTHTHTHTMECYSAIKNNEILPFATTWTELEAIRLS